MTSNQIAYWSLQEDRRAHLAKEKEENRSNLANEAESKRSHLANEKENHRSNRANEKEAKRSHKANEKFNLLDLGERTRHNMASEQIAREQMGVTYSLGLLNADVGYYSAGAGYANAAATKYASDNSYLVGMANADVAGRNATTNARNARTNAYTARQNAKNNKRRTDVEENKSITATVVGAGKKAGSKAVDYSKQKFKQFKQRAAQQKKYKGTRGGGAGHH